MNFGNEANLVWLWLVVPVAGLWTWGAIRISRRVRLMYGRNGHAMVPRQPNRFEFSVRGLILALVVVLLIMGSAQPRWGFQWQESKRQGVDIMVAIDVSQSMRAEDVSPNRLQRAKRELQDLLGMLRGDRVGLMAFAGMSFVQCPLTVDYGAIRMFLDFLDTDLIPIQGTAIGDAIRMGVESLQESSPDTSMGKAMILITDGEEQDQALDDALTLAKDAGVKVYTLGIGAAGGAPIPDVGGGFKKDQAGQVIISKWNPDLLSRIAKDTGGVAVASVAGDSDLQQIYLEGIKSSNQPQELEVVRQKLWYERFQWFVALAWLLLLWEGWMSYRKRPHRQTVHDRYAGGRVTASALAFGLWLLADAPASAASERQAHSAFQKGEYERAAELFQGVEVDRPDDASSIYNRAVAQHKAGRHAEAAEGFAKAATLADQPQLRADALFNAGNARAQAGQLEQAIQAYDESLATLADQPDVEANKQAVQAYLEQQKQEKEKQQSDESKGSEDQPSQDQQQQGSQQSTNDKHASSESSQTQPDESPSQASEEQAQQDDGSQEQKPGEGEQQNTETNHNQENNSEETAETAAQQKARQPDGEKDQHISRAEAEKLLRGVRDRARKYMVQPITREQQQKRQGGKDW